MKKHLFIILFCFAYQVGTAQEVPLKQLMAFIAQPVKEVKDTLISKGWSPKAELSGRQGNQMYETFSYGNLATDKNQALAWFRIHADDDIVNQLYYQLPGKEPYTVLLNELKVLTNGKTPIEKIEDKQVNTYYQTDLFTFQTSEGNGSYTMMVMTNKN